MPPTKAEKQAIARWDSKNMMTLGVRLRKQDALAFKEYAAKQGKNTNMLLKEFIMQCLSSDGEQTSNTDSKSDVD